jgi:hypothetical protein
VTATRTLPSPTFDEAAVHPELAAVRNAVQVGDLPAIEAVMAGLPDDTARSVAYRFVGELPDAEVHLRPLADADPPPPLAAALLASRHIELGWAVRSDVQSLSVSAEQLRAFHDHLRRAERLLISATALDPDNVPAWALRVRTAMGLQLGRSEARRRYDQVARRCPHHFFAQRWMLYQLCPKWGGSWEVVERFVEECAGQAPPGALSGALVATHHLERWQDGKSGPDPSYLRQPEVRDEVVEAAERSVLHPDHRPGYGSVDAHGEFAMAFSVMKEYGMAAAHFRAMGGVATAYPWALLGDPATVYRRYRDRALAKGDPR